MKESLTQDEIQQFIEDGFVKLENCFSDKLAEAGRRFYGKTRDVILTIQRPGLIL